MKKLIVIILMSFPVINLIAQKEAEKGFYGFTVKTIDGQDYPLSQLKGKKVMIVNTASRCGNTPQYEVLESLYKEYGGDKFVILGFPANNFASQEPGTNEQIKEFCTSSYGVTFPMMAKISVKGSDMHPLYKWLTEKSLNGVMDSEVKWNFQKYLIDENGTLSAVIAPRESPSGETVMAWIKK